MDPLQCAATMMKERIMKSARIAIYARFSTEEQDASSIDDQFTFCEQAIARLGYTDFEVTKMRDMELSGELASRPGINEVREGIEQGRWDLLISEDSSRLFRNPAACLNLVNRAVDKGVRVVCCNDRVDTDVEGWDDRLLDATRHHTQANYFTGSAVVDARGLWKLGAAVCSLDWVTGCALNRRRTATGRRGHSSTKSTPNGYRS